MKLRKTAAAFVATLMLLGGICRANAATTDTVEFYANKLLNFYRCYQTSAVGVIDSLLNRMEQTDARQADLWRKIMGTWQWVDQGMELCYDALPDGLPADDSLGIVIMGFGLNPDGTIREELRLRLETGLASAKKYPLAYIIVTGGPTAVYNDSTEAGMMKCWLLEQGIPASRIITEPNSMSTAENALLVGEILIADYPQIRSLAVITSDYHIYRSYLDFAVAGFCHTDEEGEPAWQMVGHACSDPGYERRESYSTHASDIAFIAGLDLQFQRGTALYAG